MATVAARPSFAVSFAVSFAISAFAVSAFAGSFAVSTVAEFATVGNSTDLTWRFLVTGAVSGSNSIWSTA